MKEMLARTRLSAPLVISAIALFVAIGGVAGALPGTNTVNSGDIINGQVKGQDVRENSLGIVPNAKKVKGQSVAKLAFRTTSDVGTVGPRTIFNHGGLKIRATCSTGQIALEAESSINDASIYTLSIDSADAVSDGHQQSGSFDNGDTQDLLVGGSGNYQFLSFDFDAVNGFVATGQLLVDEDGALDGCRATGHVLYG